MQTEILQELVAELGEKHACHSFVLYGSRAHGTETPASDIDIVCFGENLEPASDCRRWREYWLDAWLYPIAAVQKPEDFLHLAGGRILKEQDGQMTRLLAEVDQILARPLEPLKPFEIQHRRTWLLKTMERIRRGDPEAWFRRYWMSAELLEHDCALQGLRFRGFKTSLQQLQQRDPELHTLFLRLYSADADLALLEELVGRVLAAADS